MKNFETGTFYMTHGIHKAIKTRPGLNAEIMNRLTSYCAGDWGELGEEDKASNNEAVESGDDRILARYTTSAGPIYIITEIDRSATTILFCDEY